MLKLKLIFTINFLNLLLIKFCNGQVIDDGSERNKTLREFMVKFTNFIHKENDPCNNVVKYVCGDEHRNIDSVINYDSLRFENYPEFVKNLNENDPIISRSEIKMKNYTISCENKYNNLKEQLENLDVVKMMGDLPLLKNGNNKNFDWIQIFAKLNSYKINNILYNGIKTKSKISFSLNTEDNLTANSIIEDFDKFNILTHKSKEEKDKIINELLSFKQKVSEIKFNFKPETLAFDEFKAKFGKDIDWNKYFEIYFDVESNLLPSFTIEIDSLEQIKNYVDLIQNYDKKILANYVLLTICRDINKILKEENCSTEMNFRVIGPIVTKLLLRRGISKTGEKIYLDSRIETLQLINELQQKFNENLKNSNVIKNLENRLVKEVENITTRDKWYGNNVLDEYYNDLEINSNTYLQNIYNIRAYEMKPKSFEYPYGTMLRFHSLYRYMRNLRHSPVVYNYRWLQYIFWVPFVEDVIKSNSTEYQKASKCVTNVKEFAQSEALRLSYKTYKNWLEKNPQLRQQADEILQEFNLNNEKLFVMYSTLFTCDDHTASLDTENNDIVQMVFNCENTASNYTKKNVCKLYDL